MTWIELNGRRIDLESVAAAKRFIRAQLPDAVFLSPRQVNAQTVTHVHAEPRSPDGLCGPDAVIVEER